VPHPPQKQDKDFKVSTEFSSFEQIEATVDEKGCLLDQYMHDARVIGIELDELKNDLRLKIRDEKDKYEFLLIMSDLYRCYGNGFWRLNVVFEVTIKRGGLEFDDYDVRCFLGMSEKDESADWAQSHIDEFKQEWLHKVGSHLTVHPTCGIYLSALFTGQLIVMRRALERK
jgi:hypothetical protein